MPLPLLGRRLVDQACRSEVEDGNERVFKRGQRNNDAECHEYRDEAVLNGGRARLIGYKTLESYGHSRGPNRIAGPGTQGAKALIGCRLSGVQTIAIQFQRYE